MTATQHKWLNRLIAIIKTNQVYFKWMEAVLEFIFKITSRQSHTRDWFYNN